MKKPIFYFFIIICAVPISCNDDVDSEVKFTPELLPNKIVRNGVTSVELIFDTERKLTRLNAFSDGALTFYILCEYDAQGITEARRYVVEYGHIPDLWYVFSSDNFGRIIKREIYSLQDNFEEPNSVTTFYYDPSGRLERELFNSLAGTYYYLEEYTYGINNILIKKQRTRDPDLATEHVSEVIEYTPGDKSIYTHWQTLASQLNAIGFEDYIFDMLYLGSHKTNWNTDGKIVGDVTSEATDRQFDSNGYIIRQVLTIENLQGGPVSNPVREMTYEYTE